MSYSALRRRFDLDDGYLNDLKDELLFAHPVVDERDRGLVWTGGTTTTPEPIPIPSAHPPQVTSAPQLSPRDAERRQLTVMFCDLVGSTSLSGALDPEDLREVVRAYQSACTEVIQRYGGHVAQLLGDGLLVYFGYPQAHEDDAQRAVRTGLGIVEAIGTLNTRLEQDQGITLAVRIGIHTGLVVVGEMGGVSRQEQLALGETPNIAARIQGLAEPNTVVISDMTSRLIHGYFACEALGEQMLRGLADPVSVYRVLGESGVQSRLDVASTRGLTPLVGRESESTLLFERWEQAKDGQGQVILLSGEAGIGKSRLIQVLKDYVTDESHTRMECRSSPYFTNSALYPITDFLQRTLRFQADDTPEKKFDKLEQNLGQYRLPLEEMVPLFGDLLSLPVPEDRYLPLNLSPQRQRQKTLEAIIAIILELSERQPMLFILEDLHWTDPTTLEFIDLLIDQTPTASLYVLLTCRSEFQPSWSHRSYLTEMTINRLSQDQVEQIATQVACGKTLPREIIEQLVAKSDGVPLYVEERTKAVLESGVLKETNEHYALTAPVTSLSIPATLQDSLMARLDRLMTAKVVAQLGAVMGRQFSYALLQAVSQLDEAMLQYELNRLVEAELVYQRGVIPQATYIFKHALVVTTAYESLLRSTRQGHHQRIAAVLAEAFPETAETQPELLAHHYTEGGLSEKAVGYWHRAGQKAVERSAHVEANNHLNKGLVLLQGLPKTVERHEQELALRITLGNALIAAKGHAAPEVGSIYSQARQLCQQVGETRLLFPTLYGLWVFNTVRANHRTAYDLGEELIRLVQPHDDSGRLTAHRALGWTLLLQGDLLTSQEHFEQLVTLYDPAKHSALATLYGQDHGTVGFSYGSLVLWLRGYPDRALQRSREAVALAQDLSHPLSLAYALGFAAIFHQMRRETQTTLERAEAVITLSADFDIPLWRAWGMVPKGWALVEQREIEAGMDRISWGMDTAQTMGAELLHPYFLGLLAEACGKTGKPQEGCIVLTKALALVAKNAERWFDAELHRLKGELLLQQSPDTHTEAASCFHQAISIAQNQSAKSWELRAATSLARLWQSQDKRKEAYDLLAPVYGWFTEGFDTADLQDARTLLDELSER